mmetsp:Transcript_9785/g.33783  ORF Transcript_9785/g.33783 Transcript_9785/m.33783 type:complete len:277 (+) Transcript_9785:892-1722(+)
MANFKVASSKVAMPLAAARLAGFESSSPTASSSRSRSCCRRFAAASEASDCLRAASVSSRTRAASSRRAAAMIAVLRARGSRRNCGGKASHVESASLSLRARKSAAPSGSRITSSVATRAEHLRSRAMVCPIRAPHAAGGADASAIMSKVAAKAAVPSTGFSEASPASSARIASTAVGSLRSLTANSSAPMPAVTAAFNCSKGLAFNSAAASTAGASAFRGRARARNDAGGRKEPARPTTRDTNTSTFILTSPRRDVPPAGRRPRSASDGTSLTRD